ncbi:MAG: PPC domain-containing DNA-binding protein [Bacteroidota bacterium]
MHQQPISHAFRLKPGDDLKQSILKWVDEHQVAAGYIITCVGSLTDYNIRFANQAEGSKGSGHFEIVSMTGVLGTAGSHIHISISDSTGKTIGGHLMDGCKVYTTAEIVIGEDRSKIFARELDTTFGYKELKVKDVE